MLGFQVFLTCVWERVQPWPLVGEVVPKGACRASSDSSLWEAVGSVDSCPRSSESELRERTGSWCFNKPWGSRG